MANYGAWLKAQLRSKPVDRDQHAGADNCQRHVGLQNHAGDSILVRTGDHHLAFGAIEHLLRGRVARTWPLIEAGARSGDFRLRSGTVRL